MKINEKNLQFVNCIKKAGKISNELPLEIIFDQIQSGEYADVILKARNLIPKSKEYNLLKSELPCFLPNAYVGQRRNLNAVYFTTGLMYFDIDCQSAEEAIQLKECYKGENVLACWLSFGGNGLGMLIKVDGVTPYNFKNAYRHTADRLNLPYDEKCCDLVRINVISYDPDIYINYDARSLPCSHINTDPTTKDLVSPTKIKANSRQYFYAPVINIHYKEKMDKVIDQGNGVYFSMEGIPHFAVYGREKKILRGRRKKTIMFDTARYIWLNGHKTKQQFYDWAMNRNILFCEPELEEKEIHNVVDYLLTEQSNGNLTIRTNKKKHTWFASNCKLSGDEKRKIANQNRSLLTLNKIQSAQNNKCSTIQEISLQTGLHRNTISKIIRNQTKNEESIIDAHLPPCNTIYLYGVTECANDTFLEIESKINFFIEKNRIITQKLIAESLNKSIITIKRNWNLELKQKVKAHNQKMKKKELDYNELSSTQVKEFIEKLSINEKEEHFKLMKEEKKSVGDSLKIIYDLSTKKYLRPYLILEIKSVA